MQIIRSIFILLFSILFGFGAWYLVFWFLTAQSNPLEWHGLVKLIYLFLGYTAMVGIAEAIDE